MTKKSKTTDQPSDQGSRQAVALRSGKDVGGWLRRERRSRGWTQAELASHAGITPEQVSRIESAVVDPRISTMIALAAAMKLDLVGAARGAHMELLSGGRATRSGDRHGDMEDLF